MKFNTVPEIMETLNNNNLQEKEMMLRYSTIFNAAPVGLEYYDKDGILIDINESALRIHGCTDKEHLLNSRICLYDNPNYKLLIKDETDRYQSHICSFDYDFDLPKKENYYLKGQRLGKARFQNKIEPILNKKGEIEGTILAISDITEDYNRNYRYEQLYREKVAISDALPIGLAIYDKDANQQFINPAIASIFGVTDIKAHLEKHINLFDDPIIPDHLKEKVRQGKNVEANISYNPQIASQASYFDTTFSEPIYLSCQAITIKDSSDKTEAIMLLISDITKDKKKSQELQEANQNLSLALEAGELAAWIFNIREKKFYTLMGNALAGDGITLEQNLEILHPDDRQMQLDLIYSIINGEREKGTAVFRYRSDHPEEKYRYYESQIIVKKIDGVPTHLTGTQKDVTEWFELTEKLKKTNKQNALILNNINSGLVYISSDYKVIWENISCLVPAEKTTGIKYYEAGKLCFQSARNADTPCEGCVMAKAMASKKIEHSEFSSFGKTVEIYANPILNVDNEVEGVILRIDDITHRKQIQNELETTKNEALASNEELKLAKEKAEQSDKLKSSFLANMSHEIRTPLNAIIGFSELLQQSDSETERAEYWNIISTNNDLLLTLINDILDLSKIEAGYVDLSNYEFDLPLLFEELTLLYKLKMPAEVTFICDSPFQSYIVNFDRKRLTQVMVNFVNNAIKFTQKGSIKIGYSINDEGLKLYCSDTGIGIAEGNRKKIFDRFEKLNDFVQGTGLGLSICKAIVAAQGGTIGVDSETGKGSTFWVYIPWKQD